MKRRLRNFRSHLLAGLGSTLLISAVAFPLYAENLPDIHLPPADPAENGEVAVPRAKLYPPAAPISVPTRIRAINVQSSEEVGTGIAAEAGDSTIADEGTSSPPRRDLRLAELRPIDPPAFDNSIPDQPAELGLPREDVAPGDEADGSLPAESLPEANESLAEETTAEIIYERYQDGRVRTERGVKQDANGNYVLHGDWRLYDPEGAILAEGQYVNNVRHGEWRRYYRGNDALLFTSTPYREFNGPFVSQAFFNQGKLDQVWTIIDSKERVVSAIEFSNGQRHGVASWYHPNGKLAHELHYANGKIDGEAQLWDAKGELLHQELYQTGRRIGLQSSKYSNGQMHVEAECLFAPVAMKAPDDWWNCTLAKYETEGTDERHGRFTVWHANGIKQREGRYSRGTPVGQMTWWYPNGQKQLQGEFVEGKAGGTWTWWHQNGLKSISGEYASGAPQGEWMWWNENGKVAQRVDLEHANEKERSAWLKQIPLPTTPLR